MAETEDIPYEISDHAVAEKNSDDDTVQKSGVAELVKSVNKYIDEAIAEHTGWDLIDLTEQAKMTATQQIAVHKLVINHLRNIKEQINNREEE